MEAIDVMTRGVVTVSPETPVTEVARLLLTRGVSAVPVVDASGRLVGIVSEGDLVRRPELGTEAERSPWVRLWYSRQALADDFVKSHGRTAAQVMTPDVITVSEHTPLTEVVELMEKHHVKRLPVVRDSALVGIIGRANLVRALLMAGYMPGPKPNDDAIRTRIATELKQQSWAPGVAIDLGVFDGVVMLWGTVESSEQHEALRILAESSPGVRQVKSFVRIPAAQAPPSSV
jgi:CBS domain-containing protein